MPLWSKVLKEAGPGWGERVIPLRALSADLNGEQDPGNDKAGSERGKVSGPAVAAAREEAAAILEQARREAAAIKAAALEENQKALEEGRAAAEARGYREGLARAEEEAAVIRREAETLREEARQVLKNARRVYRETISAAEGDIIELALAIAAKIIAKEVELRPDLVLEIARQAIRQVAEGQDYIIYASPETAEVIRQHRAELLAEAAPGARLQVVEDPGFRACGCRVETENGFVDAGVDSQLEELKKILRGDTRVTHPDFQSPTPVLAGGGS